MALTIGIFIIGLLVCAASGLGGLAWMLAMAAVSFTAGALTPRYRGLAWLGIAAGVLGLALARALPLTGLGWTAPVGISYFALRMVSYNADIYLGRYPPERRFWRYGLYISYLPALFLGPIEGYDHFQAAAFQDRRCSWDDFSLGTARVLRGAFKKLVVAARAGVVIGVIRQDPEQFRGAFALLAMVLYSVQLYADFSGGIDMALGVSRMLGIRLMENFDRPFSSETVGEFWRRWHRSLGAWLRTYIYIPLGGNRKGKLRRSVNVVVTFLVSGLWHGTDYLLWGALNGVLAATGDLLKTRWTRFNRLLTGLLVSLLWTFFIWTPGQALAMLGSVFSVFNYGALLGSLGSLGLNAGEGTVFLLSLVVLWLFSRYAPALRRRFLAWSPAGRTAAVCGLGLVVLIFGMYGIGFDAEAFIYSRF